MAIQFPRGPCAVAQGHSTLVQRAEDGGAHHVREHGVPAGQALDLCAFQGGGLRRAHPARARPTAGCRRCDLRRGGRPTAAAERRKALRAEGRAAPARAAPCTDNAAMIAIAGAPACGGEATAMSADLTAAAKPAESRRHGLRPAGPGDRTSGTSNCRTGRWAGGWAIVAEPGAPGATTRAGGDRGAGDRGGRDRERCRQPRGASVGVAEADAKARPEGGGRPRRAARGLREPSVSSERTDPRPARGGADLRRGGEGGGRLLLLLRRRGRRRSADGPRHAFTPPAEVERGAGAGASGQAAGGGARRSAVPGAEKVHAPQRRKDAREPRQAPPGHEAPEKAGVDPDAAARRSASRSQGPGAGAPYY
jgi:hypothetical protein